MALLRMIGRMRHWFQLLRFLSAALAGTFLIVSSQSGATAGVFSRSQARVLVDSYAKESYEETKNGDGEPRLETYHFFEGRHFGGNIRDKSLRDVTFEEIAQSLAEEMKLRNYYPASSPEGGNFLIVVHWGVTGIEEPLDELFLNEPGDTGIDAPDIIFDGASGNTSQDFSADATNDFETYDRGGASRSDEENAVLIGFDRALNRKGVIPQDEHELQLMLKDERYFIILMAYDWQKLRTEKEYDLIWSTRFSLDAMGTNFREAHFALSRGASNYFGTNLDGELGKAKTNLGPGDVELGEIEVVEQLTDKDQKK